MTVLSDDDIVRIAGRIAGVVKELDEIKAEVIAGRDVRLCPATTSQAVGSAGLHD